MEHTYRNNAGRFRLEAGVQKFLPPTAPPPALSASASVSSPPCTSSSRRLPQWFFSGSATIDSRELLLRKVTLQESCPSIHLLSGGGPRSVATTPGPLKKPHSSSAPNEGITGAESVLSPPTPVLGMLRKRNVGRRRPSLSGGGPVHLENPERETRWYFKYFLGKAHRIFCGNISEKDPLLLAIVKSEFEAEGLRQYRAILWTKFGSQKLCISNSFTNSVSPKKILCLFDIHRLEKGLKEIIHYEAQREALTLEEQEFGVLYCMDGQTSDEEMYNNENGSPQYQAFLRLLGDRITLKNWDRFKGGLDTKTETTGIESVYTIYEGHEIMFHVSTLLPISTDNRQQANGPYRRAFSEIVQDSAEGSPSTKDQNRNDAFIRFGQPWQPRRLHMKMHGDISCGDAWGKVLLTCVDGGVYALEEHQQPLLLIDKSVDVKQLKVAESFGIMILRHDKGRESRISVLQLSDLPLAEVVDRGLVKRHTLDRSRGCHLFSTSTSATRPLRLVLAVGRRLLIYQWQVEITGRSLSSWNQFTYSELTARFVFVREVPTSEVVQVLSILDSNMGGRICAGYRNQFDLLDERTGETLHLYKTENGKSQAVAVVEMRSDDDLELLLCFNRNCYLQRITKRNLPFHAHSDLFNVCSSLEVLEHQIVDGNSSTSPLIKPCLTSNRIQTTATTDYNFSWNFEPKHIVLAHPYILAFTESAIEFRLLLNGSLVHTMTVPNCILLSSKHDIYFASSSEALHQSVLSSSICRPPPLMLLQTPEIPQPARHVRLSQRIGSPHLHERSSSGDSSLEYSGVVAATRTPPQGGSQDTSNPPSTCLAMGSSEGGGSQHHAIRYIYCIPLQTLTGRHYDGSPDRSSCESPNPIRVLEKIRDIRDNPDTLQFFPISPS
ncbi:unnamed protein product [Mesocestoides corti]|uniref:Rap-GAP domain-containing protein n=1 Tax=Mesocestoides corti TaxID=53468 RepID=A0A158QV82_MESCO|nr:unnamed protein product [Mesocestoides corti]